MASNNYSLNTADRLTHVKIMVLSLVACIIVVCIGIAAMPDMSTPRAPVLRAYTPMIWTQSDGVTIR